MQPIDRRRFDPQEAADAVACPVLYGLPRSGNGQPLGIGLLEAVCANRLLMNDFINYFVTPPTGYEEAYDAEWKCEETVNVDRSAWGRVKSLYR